MIDVPPKACDSVFEKEFQRGCILKTKVAFSDGSSKNKYIVILNKSTQDEQAIFFVTTSQLDFYDKHPHFNTDIIRIKPGEMEFFPKETVINCRKLEKSPREQLKKRYASGMLKFVGILPEDTLKQIDEIVRNSRFISLSDKQSIISI